MPTVQPFASDVQATCRGTPVARSQVTAAAAPLSWTCQSRAEALGQMCGPTMPIELPSGSDAAALRGTPAARSPATAEATSSSSTDQTCLPEWASRLARACEPAMLAARPFDSDVLAACRGTPVARSRETMAAEPLSLMCPSRGEATRLFETCHSRRTHEPHRPWLRRERQQQSPLLQRVSWAKVVTPSLSDGTPRLARVSQALTPSWVGPEHRTFPTGSERPSTDSRHWIAGTASGF